MTLVRPASLRLLTPRLARSITSAVPPAAGAGTAPRHSQRSRALLALGGVALATGAVLTLRSGANADSDAPRRGIAAVPTPALIRSYAVYTVCGMPRVIDASPALLHALTHSPIPGVKAITEFAIRHTFFGQFVAGEDIPECIHAMTDMNSRGVGGVLNYSAEAEVGDGQSASRSEQRALVLEEVKHAIDSLGEFERQLGAAGGQTGSSSFALKVTGLIDPEILERASNTLLRLRPLQSSSSIFSLAGPIDPVPYPGVPQNSDALVIAPTPSAGESLLPTMKGTIEPIGVLATDKDVTEEDLTALRKLWGDLRDLSDRAREKGVKLMIDAEHSGTQPALDAMSRLLSMEFNRPTTGVPFNGPVIFGTYQSYLRRAPYLLEEELRNAEEGGYALGIKIVRGAYVNRERQKWIKEGRSGSDPIWPNKTATDLAYDTSLATIMSTLTEQLDGPNPELALSVVFATHNPNSVELVVDSLEKTALAERVNGPDGNSRLRLRDDVRGKVFVAQLYGMRDDITDRVTEVFDSGTMPVALKYIAYGKLDEVVPFLARRAIENKSVMTGEGGATAERKRVADELWRRIKGA